MTRRTAFLAVSSATAAVAFPAIWMSRIEPRWFQLTRTRVRMPNARPTRLLHISDLHVSDGMTAEDLETGLRMGLAQRPDLICFTGDFVSTTSGFDRAGLHRLLRRAAGAAPTFAVLGNHDGGAWLARHGGERSTALLGDIVQSAGVRLLQNESARCGMLTIAGVGDLWTEEYRPSKAFAKALSIDAQVPTVVLCHNPDGKEGLRPYRWDLMLSGHTHGGQGRIPGVPVLWAPVRDRRYIAGLGRWEGGRQIFLSRGLGSPKHVRAFCRPEVSLLELGS